MEMKFRQQLKQTETIFTANNKSKAEAGYEKGVKAEVEAGVDKDVKAKAEAKNTSKAAMKLQSESGNIVWPKVVRKVKAADKVASKDKSANTVKSVNNAKAIHTVKLVDTADLVDATMSTNAANLACLRMPTLLGLESACKEELFELGFSEDRVKAHDGLVSLYVPRTELAETVALLNLSLRTAERVLISLVNFTCTDFTTLFNTLEDFNFEAYLDAGYFLEVVGYSHDSKLHSVPALQGLIKKAIIKRLANYSLKREEWYVDGIWQENRNIGINRLKFGLNKDEFSLDLDTSGFPLYKRGYRPLNHPAPIRETLAAAILYYAHFTQNCLEHGELLFDPVCGSGTFLIEAALLMTNTAPGIERVFSAESMQIVGKEVFTKLRAELKAKSLVYNPALKAELLAVKDRLFGADIEPKAILQAKQNATRAHVADLINFACANLHSYAKIANLPFPELDQAERVLILANPPYGERLGTEKEVKALHLAFRNLCFVQGKQAKLLEKEKKFKSTSKLKPKYRFSLITSHPALEKELGVKADKRRKLYNGMLACTLYQYFRHE